MLLIFFFLSVILPFFSLCQYLSFKFIYNDTPEGEDSHRYTGKFVYNIKLSCSVSFCSICVDTKGFINTVSIFCLEIAQNASYVFELSQSYFLIFISGARQNFFIVPEVQKMQSQEVAVQSLQLSGDDLRGKYTVLFFAFAE